MADFYDNGRELPIDLETYIGNKGDIILPIDGKENSQDVYIRMSVLEATEFLDNLSATIEEYKNTLNNAA